MRRRLWLMAAVVLALAGAGAWAALSVLGQGASITDSPRVGKPVPNVSLRQAEGDGLVRLASPGQVVVINFWAPWCVPCLGEHQMLNRVVGSYSPDDVRFVAVSYQSDASAVSTFLDRVGRNVPALADEQGTAAIEFGVSGVPETFFVDREGVVRARVAGPLSQRLLTKIVDRLLNGQPVDDIKL